MGLFLHTERRGKVGIAVCDRCKTKRSVEDLVKDPNFPGLRVCFDTCVDNLDPWRLPPRATENITLTAPRPDTPILTAAQQYIVEYLLISGTFLVGELFVGQLSQNIGLISLANSIALVYAPVQGLGFSVGERIVGSTSGAVGIIIRASIVVPGPIGVFPEADIAQADIATVVI